MIGQMIPLFKSCLGATARMPLAIPCERVKFTICDEQQIGLVQPESIYFDDSLVYLPAGPR